MDPSYELFDHTADMGIRVRAATLPEMIQPATAGLYAVVGDLVGRGEPRPVRLDLVADDPAVLLRDFLAELLVLFDRDHRFAVEVDVTTFTHDHLTVTVSADALDNERSVLHHEVKAVTYHDLELRKIPGGYEVALIVDI